MEEVERGSRERVNCEHVQALETNIFQRHWEWQEDRRIELSQDCTYGLYGELGREHGIRRGRALSGIKRFSP